MLDVLIEIHFRKLLQYKVNSVSQEHVTFISYQIKYLQYIYVEISYIYFL